MSYSKWLKEQSIEFQNDALGRKLANDFRNGNYAADRFREYGKPMSLNELNEKDDLCLRGNDVKG